MRPGEVGLLANTYLDCASRAAAAHQAYLEALTGPYTASPHAVVSRQFAAFDAARDEATEQAEVTRKLCQKLSPELLGALPIALQDLPPLKKGDGRLGVGLSRGTDRLFIVSITRKSPADRGRLRAGDLILGVVDGPTLTTQAEFGAYVRPRAGQKIVFRVRRENDAKRLTVTPEAYHP